MLPKVSGNVRTELTRQSLNNVINHSKTTNDQNIQFPNIDVKNKIKYTDDEDKNDDDELFEEEEEEVEEEIECDFIKKGENKDITLTSYQLYLEKCKEQNLYPDKCIQDFLIQHSTTSLKLEEKTIDEKKFAILCTVLRKRKNISHLNLKGTNIPATSISILCHLLGKNHQLTDLNLSHNMLHGKGALILSKAFDSTMITRLNLQFTGLGDSDLDILKESFANNSTLLNLTLSHNNFSEKSGITFGYILQNNTMLEKLNVSWNCIRRSGACDLAKGLGHNGTLLYLTVAFNGFGNEGAAELGNSLAENVVLVSLNVKHNRITNRGATLLSRGLYVNDTLKELDVSGNLITFEGAQHVLRSVVRNRTLAELHMGRLSPDKVCMTAIKYLQRNCPNMVITYGAPCSLSNLNTMNRKTIVHKDVFNAIRVYLSSEHLRMLDLFMKWDKRRNGYLTYDELERGLISCKISVTKQVLEYMFQRLDEDNSGTIEYRDFVVAIAKLP